MAIGFTAKVSNVAIGDTIISPFSGDKLLVREIVPVMLGLLDFSCLDVNGDRRMLTLDPDETIQVLDN